MIQFLQSHFKYLNQYQLGSPSNEVPYYTTLKMSEYLRLVNLYELIYETKRDIEKISHELVHMEKHIVWAMYYNWREEQIESVANVTFATRLAIRDVAEL